MDRMSSKQKMAKPGPQSSWLPTALHLGMLLHHGVMLQGFAAIDSVMDSFTDPVIVRIKPFRLLTISGWCFALQLFHVNLSLAARWQQWRGGDARQQRRLANAADVCFRALVLPCVLLVSVVFWSLCLVDRNLVYPCVWDSVVPPWLNHGIHSSTALFALLELLVVRRSGDGSKRLEANVYWTLSIGYALLMNTVFLLFGVWFYPFLGLVSWPRRLMLEGLFSLSGRLILELSWRLDGVGVRVKGQ